MRVWDIAAGYLNRQSLLGEHREVHGVHAILRLGKLGYSRHPETVRWKQALSGLARRHRQLAAEMALRGYLDRTPLPEPPRRADWPDVFITIPSEQFELLRRKYVGREPGRIALPRSARQLLLQHDYSILARDRGCHRQMARHVGRARGRGNLAALAQELTLVLREPPPRAELFHALELMWRRVAGAATAEERAERHRTPAALLDRIQRVARRQHDPYLLASTALSELAAFGEMESGAVDGGATT